MRQDSGVSSGTGHSWGSRAVGASFPEAGQCFHLFWRIRNWTNLGAKMKAPQPEYQFLVFTHGQSPRRSVCLTQKLATATKPGGYDALSIPSFAA